MSIELLAPAGSPEALDAAIGEGADAVYLGLKSFNARMRSANFTWSQFEAAARSVRRMGKKIYVTVNTVFEQREADRMYQLLKYLSTIGPDALIVQDFGVLAMVRSLFPRLKIHASTQMNIASSKGCNNLSRQGVTRVVLARELSREELRSIRADTNVELEIFVHGALCVSASGLCLFSSFLGGKSANRGICTQACRRLYHHGDIDAGYYFSPADLQLLEHLPDIADTGINALKIEGRMKSAEYVGTVVSAYRLVLDAIAEGNQEKMKHSIAEGQKILQGDFARKKTTFHFHCSTLQNLGTGQLSQSSFIIPQQDGGTGINLGIIKKVQGAIGERRALVTGEDSPTGIIPLVGDSIRIHRSDDSARVSHKAQYAEAVGGGSFWVSIPDGFDRGDRIYLIQTKAMSKRYKPVIPPNAKAGGRSPGHDKAPVPVINAPNAKKNKSSPFPDGLYVAVSAINDLYIVQSSRPQRVMLSLNRKNARYLFGEGKKPIPFKPADIILVLEPFFPQDDVEYFSDIIPELFERGYRQFTINNLGHFSLFRDIRPEVQLIAGPWLYTFNTWALSYIVSLGVEGIVSPLENNRQNLERSIGTEKTLRSMVFVPVFAWPPLFRIRTDLGSVYDFKEFADNRGEQFNLVGNNDGSLVYPEKPFAITDKIPFLKEAGFRRFIIDLSGRSLKKNDYKDLMSAVSGGIPLPRISRFNWKNGFFNAGEDGLSG